MRLISTLPLALLLAVAGTPAVAQEKEPERIPFSGGELTITETEDFEKILAFDGRELARDYFVLLDRIAEIGGTDVAFVNVGPGGNACAPSVVMIWRQQDGEVATDTTGDDCATPAPAVTDYDVFFVPYLLPGEKADLRAWNPEERFRMHGELSYAPEPGSTWSSFDPESAGHPLDLFRNAGIYDEAEDLLGDDLVDVATGLGTSGKPEISADGLLSARGCVPHACGGSDTFIVVDKQEESLFFAQQGDPARFWPERAEWPEKAAALIPSDF